MKKYAPIFLQLFIVLFDIIVLAALIRLPLTEGRAANLDILHIYTDPFILYFYAISIPFFIASYQLFILLGMIRKNQIFSLPALQTMTSIRKKALLLCVLIGLAGLYIRLFHDKNDDPVGFLVLCAATILLLLVITAATTLFATIIQKGIDLSLEKKPENTVE